MDLNDLRTDPRIKQARQLVQKIKEFDDPSTYFKDRKDELEELSKIYSGLQQSLEKDYNDALDLILGNYLDLKDDYLKKKKDMQNVAYLRGKNNRIRK